MKIKTLLRSFAGIVAAVALFISFASPASALTSTPVTLTTGHCTLTAHGYNQSINGVPYATLSAWLTSTAPGGCNNYRIVWTSVSYKYHNQALNEYANGSVSSSTMAAYWGNYTAGIVQIKNVATGSFGSWELDAGSTNLKKI